MLFYRKKEYRISEAGASYDLCTFSLSLFKRQVIFGHSQGETGFNAFLQKKNKPIFPGNDKKKKIKPHFPWE